MDDTTIYATATSLDKVAEKLNAILEKLYEWLRRNQHSSHPQKTEYILLTRGRHFVGPSQQILLGGNTVKLVESSRCLGIQSDNELKWDTHVNEQIKSTFALRKKQT